MRTRLALWLYRCLLVFYPRGFRTEFEVEMKAVFAQALGDPRASSARLLWRELRDWPGVVWRARHADRRKMMVPTNSFQTQLTPAHQLVTVGSWRDACLAALGYLFYLWWAVAGPIWSALRGPLHLTSKMQGILAGVSGGAILAFDLIVVLLCWRGSWPRWSLPYLGMVLTWLLFFAQSLIRFDGSLLIYVTPLVAFVLFLLAVLGWWWKGLRSLYERLHSDWTLIGLAYFSCTPLIFIAMTDETRYQDGVNLILSVILALGVLAYMRCTSLWQRAVVLPVAFTAASLVAMFYLQLDYHSYYSWKPYFASDTFRMLAYWEAVAIAPMLIVGILELGRYAFNRWLQAA